MSPLDPQISFTLACTAACKTARTRRVASSAHADPAQPPFVAINRFSVTSLQAAAFHSGLSISFYQIKKVPFCSKLRARGGCIVSARAQL